MTFGESQESSKATPRNLRRGQKPRRSDGYGYNTEWGRSIDNFVSSLNCLRKELAGSSTGGRYHWGESSLKKWSAGKGVISAELHAHIVGRMSEILQTQWNSAVGKERDYLAVGLKRLDFIVWTQENAPQVDGEALYRKWKKRIPFRELADLDTMPRERKLAIIEQICEMVAEGDLLIEQLRQGSTILVLWLPAPIADKLSKLEFTEALGRIDIEIVTVTVPAYRKFPFRPLPFRFVPNQRGQTEKLFRFWDRSVAFEKRRETSAALTEGWFDLLTVLVPVLGASERKNRLGDTSPLFFSSGERVLGRLPGLERWRLRFRSMDFKAFCEWPLIALIFLFFVLAVSSGGQSSLIGFGLVSGLSLALAGQLTCSASVSVAGCGAWDTRNCADIWVSRRAFRRLGRWTFSFDFNCGRE